MDNDQRFLNFEHYKNVVESQAFDIVKNEDELIFAINLNLNFPQRKQQKRKELLELEVGKSLIGTSERFVDLLNQIAENHEK